jgi:muconolactone D-isomerase
MDLDAFLRELPESPDGRPRRRRDRPPLEAQGEEDIMEFLVEFEIDVPDETPESEVSARETAEAAAAAKLVDEGHLLRVWKRPGDGKVLGLYRADSEAQLDGLLGALPLYEWMHVDVTPLEPHPNDPAADQPSPDRGGR